MKLQNANNQEIIIGGGKEMQFSIDDSNPVIFDILRNKMYSNKIGAICREVSSNSRDANREAGVADKAITIEFTYENALFNTGDVCIIFKDSGLGISPDRMENIFMKYAASTKRDSNAQTGGFGLGAKTPFAYTDSFMIRTVCDINGDNWEYTYNAIIDRTGKGKMIVLDEVMTNKPTGTEIIVPIVSEQDRKQFETECYKATIFWSNVNYVNFNTSKPNLDIILQGEGYKIVNSIYNLFGSTSYLGLLDGIPYPLTLKDKYAGLGSSYHILLDLDVEKLIINANRESIQYEEETYTYLNSMVDVITKDIEKIITPYLTEHVNYREALLKHQSINKGISYKADLAEKLLQIQSRFSSNSSVFNGIDNLHLLYKGVTVDGNLKLKAHNIYMVSLDEYEVDDEGKVEKVKFEYKHKASLDVNTLNKTFIMFDVKRHNVAKQLHIYNEISGGNFILIKQNIVNSTQESIEDDLKLLEEFDINYLMFSEIKPKVEKVEYTRKISDFKKIRCRVVNNWSSHSEELALNKKTNELTFIDKDLDKSKNFFILVDYLRDVDEYKYSSLKRQIRAYKSVKVIEEVFFVNRSSYHANDLAKLGYKLLDINSIVLDADYFQKLHDFSNLKTFINEVDSDLLNNFSDILPKSLINKYEEYLTTKDEFENIRSKIDDNIWDYVKVKSSVFNYEGLRKKIKRTLALKYPMLIPYLNKVPSADSGYVDQDLRRERALKNIRNYINFINNECNCNSNKH